MSRVDVFFVEVCALVGDFCVDDPGGEIAITFERAALGSVGFETADGDPQWNALVTEWAEWFVGHSACASPAGFEKDLPHFGIEMGYGESAVAGDLAGDVSAGVRGRGRKGVEDLSEVDGGKLVVAAALHVCFKELFVG